MPRKRVRPWFGFEPPPTGFSLARASSRGESELFPQGFSSHPSELNHPGPSRRTPSPRAAAAVAALLVDRTLSRQTPSLLWPLSPADYAARGRLTNRHGRFTNRPRRVTSTTIRLNRRLGSSRRYYAHAGRLLVLRAAAHTPLLCF